MERRSAEVGQVSVRWRGERAPRPSESVEGRHQGRNSMGLKNRTKKCPKMAPKDFLKSINSLTVYRAGYHLLGFEDENLGRSPRLVGRYCNYLLPKQTGVTTQFIIFKTLRMIGRPALYTASSKNLPKNKTPNVYWIASQGVQLDLSRGLRGHQHHRALRRQDILDTARHLSHLVRFWYIVLCSLHSLDNFLMSIYTVGCPLSRDVLFSFLLKVPVTNCAAQ